MLIENNLTKMKKSHLLRYRIGVPIENRNYSESDLLYYSNPYFIKTFEEEEISQKVFLKKISKRIMSKLMKENNHVIVWLDQNTTSSDCC